MGHGRRRRLRRRTRRRRQLRLLLQPHRRALQLSLIQLRSPTQTACSTQHLSQTAPPKDPVPVPPCSTSSARSRRAAPESWTVVPAWALSASSTRFSCSPRPPCPGGACSNAASKFGFPQSRPPCCRPRLLLLLHHL